MNDTRSVIQQSISKILIAIILMFAFTSTGNVIEFVHLYHKGWTGVSLGATFGVTVFTCAYIAATAKRHNTRITAIVIGCVFGIASATFQSYIYIRGGAPLFVAAALSYIPIVAGEVGLAILEHFYSADCATEQVQLSSSKASFAPVQSAVALSAIAQAVAQTEHIQGAVIEPFAGSNQTVITPRNEREVEFWNMLNEQVQYKITALSKQWNVAPNTLRNWRERWRDAQLNNTQFAQGSGD